MAKPHPHLALIAAALFAAAHAHAQDKTLYIGMNGGDMERSYTKYVFPAFEKIHGVKVVVVPGTSSDILAKVQASKEKPPVHVMFLDDGIMVRAIGMGLCEKQRPSPALNDLYAANLWHVLITTDRDPDTRDARIRGRPVALSRGFPRGVGGQKPSSPLRASSRGHRWRRR